MTTRSHYFLIPAIMLMLLALASRSRAQDFGATEAVRSSTTSSQSTREGIQKRWNEWGVWGGISFDAPTVFGTTPSARFGNIGLRYGRVLVASKTVAFEWTIDAVPLAILSNERFVFVPGTGYLGNRKTVYGAGASPIGLKFNFRRDRRVQPFGQATGGFLYFSQQVPVAGASQFNFTFDFNGGVQIVNSNRHSFTIGYKFQHISNGRTATFNPGVDAQMIFGGFSLFR
jgi:hypothetical protein